MLPRPRCRQNLFIHGSRTAAGPYVKCMHIYSRHSKRAFVALCESNLKLQYSLFKFPNSHIDRVRSVYQWHDIDTQITHQTVWFNDGFECTINLVNANRYSKSVLYVHWIWFYMTNHIIISPVLIPICSFYSSSNNNHKIFFLNSWILNL